MQGGYFTLLNSVYDLGLDPYQFYVYTYLIRLSHNGGTAFPSINNIAEKCNMSVRKVGYVIRELEEKKLIEIVHRKEGNTNKSNVYRITSNTAQHAGDIAQHAEGIAQNAEKGLHNMQEGSAQHADNKELSINNKDYKKLDKKSSPSPSEIVKEIINYLNEKTGKRFSHKSEANSKLINARLREGRTLYDFKHVIDVKCEEWQGDSEMDKYLRPATLFSQMNFENYVNQNLKGQKRARILTNDEAEKKALRKWCDSGNDPDEFYERWNYQEQRFKTETEIEQERLKVESLSEEFNSDIRDSATTKLSH